MLDHVQFSLTQIPEPFFAEPHSSQAGSPQLISSQVQDWTFVLTEFHKVPFDPFLQPVCISLAHSLPLNISAILFTLTSSTSLMRVPFVATSGLLIKTLNRTGLRLMQYSTSYTIIESLSLQKACKIIKSNHPPNTTMPAKSCPEVSNPHVF